MGYALYNLSKEDAAIFVKLTEKCWNGKERDLSKLNKYERGVLLKLMGEAGEYKPKKKVGKSFNTILRKFNPYHDPKTGRFTSKSGGSGGIMANMTPELKAEYDKRMKECLYLGTDADYVPLEIELMSVLKPGAKVHLTRMDKELAKETVNTIKSTIEKYPVLKNAIDGIQVGGELNENYKTHFDESPNAMAYFNKKTGVIALNPNYYGDKTSFKERYESSVGENFHPKGTDYNSVVVHEMGHALDNYFYKQTGRIASVEISKSMSKSGLSDYNSLMENLCKYSTTNAQEFFAEAFAEYVCSPKPREIATAVGASIDRRISLLPSHTREGKAE